MKICSLSGALSVALVTSLFAPSSTPAAERPETWQLALEYNKTSLRALDASICQSAVKKIVTPAVAGSPVRITYDVEWLNESGAVIYATQTELPLGTITTLTGNEPCIRRISESGFLTLRLAGPGLNSNPKSIRLTRSGSTRATGFSEALPNLFSQQALLVPIEQINSGATPPEGPISSLKVRDVGPDSNRLVFVFLGDGYTAANLANGDFDADVQTVVSAFIGRPPWDALFDAVNIYQISVESVEEGADNNPLGTLVNTYFNSTYWTSGIERALTVDGIGYNRAVAAANAFVGVGMWDELVMLVNSQKYGGTGGQISVISMHSAAPEILLHEIGHTFAGLADEYDYGGSGPPTWTGEPNVDLNFNPPKWNAWILPSTPLPTPQIGFDTVVGAFEGAKYFPTGSYRPWNICEMNALGYEFDPVCQEAHVIEMTNRISLLDDYTSNTPTYLIDTSGMTFSATPAPLNGLTYQWKVNGRIPSCGNDPTFQISGEELPDYVNTIELAVNFPTPKVRQDTLLETFSWTAVMDCNGNGINDSLDILAGEPDANGNGIIDACEFAGCCVTPGDADGSGGTNIGDVTYLIAHIFSGGPPPVCPDEGDPDMSGSVNIADVTFLIARIFSGGPAPGCLFQNTGGADWTALPCQMPQDIYAIWGLADDDIYAVGNAGLILHYDGFGWSQQPGGAGKQLVAVWGSASDNVYALGFSDGVILHYNGSDWTSEPNASSSNLFSIWGSGPNDIFVSGFNMVEHYDGASWTVSHSESFAFLTGVWGSGATDVYVVGFGGKMLHYDGVWTTLPTVTPNDLNAIWGSGPNDIFAVGDAGTVLHSSGGAWSAMSSGVSDNLNCIWGASPGDVYAAGDNGAIIHFNGSTWETMTGSTSANLRGIWGAAASAHTVGETGVILQLGN